MRPVLAPPASTARRQELLRPHLRLGRGSGAPGVDADPRGQIPKCWLTPPILLGSHRHPGDPRPGLGPPYWPAQQPVGLNQPSCHFPATRARASALLCPGGPSARHQEATDVYGMGDPACPWLRAFAPLGHRVRQAGTYRSVLCIPATAGTEPDAQRGRCLSSADLGSGPTPEGPGRAWTWPWHTASPQHTWHR